MVTCLAKISLSYAMTVWSMADAATPASSNATRAASTIQSIGVPSSRCLANFDIPPPRTETFCIVDKAPYLNVI